MKSIREMNARERQHFSLAAKTFRASAMGCILLGLIALIIGLGLYTLALTGQVIRHAFDLASYASVSTTHGADSVKLAGEVMSIYRGLSEEERQKNGTPEYRDFFSSLDLGKGSNYSTLINILRTYLEKNEVDYFYLAMYDEENNALVYIADTDRDDPLLPGEWEAVSGKEVRRFLDWDGEGMCYYIGHTEQYGWLCTAGVPIRNADGEIVVFLLADLSVDQVWEGMKDYMLQITLALLAATAVIAWFLTRHMKKTLVNPINEIAGAAQNYVKDRRAGDKDTDHFASLNIRTGDEVENLSLVMADMERDLSEYEENLTKITAEKERISTELSLATRIQTAMLPHIFPPFPGRKEFDLYASMDPAKEVGGDFYDFFLVDDDHLCMVMADVSGKGVPAALFMMASKIILQSCAMLGGSPAEILTKTNEAICSNNQEKMFVTVWLGILEVSTGKLTAANAGHEYPALKRSDGAFELIRDEHGFVIGCLAGMKYSEYELTLEKGTKLFLYTDGVPEATDAGNKMFGTERMLAALNEQPEAAPEQLLKNVRCAVDGFVKEAEQFDDLTMLCMEYKGKDEAI